MEKEWVVYRTGYPSGALEYIEQEKWDAYLKSTPDTKCLEVSRGHTQVDAKNLTMLANDGIKGEPIWQ